MADSQFRLAKQIIASVDNLEAPKKKRAVKKAAPKKKDKKEKKLSPKNGGEEMPDNSPM